MTRVGRIMHARQLQWLALVLLWFVAPAAAGSPLNERALMLRQAHASTSSAERGDAYDVRISAHPEPVEGRAEIRFQKAVASGPSAVPAGSGTVTVFAAARL